MIKAFQNKKFLVLLALVNFLAGFYSISYYLWQLEKINPLLWVFVIDCPFYAILFGLNLILLLKNKPSAFLTLVSIVGNLKYGFWTIIALILPGILFSFPVLLVGHLLLIVEVIVFFKITKFKVKHFIPVFVWFIFNDILDYFFGLHPFFEDGLFFEMMIVSFVLSLILSVLISTFFSANNHK
jgi:uncharacterized membrane protein YpjA